MFIILPNGTSNINLFPFNFLLWKWIIIENIHNIDNHFVVDIDQHFFVISNYRKLWWKSCQYNFNWEGIAIFSHYRPLLWKTRVGFLQCIFRHKSWQMNWWLGFHWCHHKVQVFLSLGASRGKSALFMKWMKKFYHALPLLP